MAYLEFCTKEGGGGDATNKNVMLRLKFGIELIFTNKLCFLFHLHKSMVTNFLYEKPT